MRATTLAIILLVIGTIGCVVGIVSMQVFHDTIFRNVVFLGMAIQCFSVFIARLEKRKA